MSTEQQNEHGGYSRIGTLVFVLTMAFPFVALGWKLLSESPLSFAIYAAMVVLMALLILIAVRFAPGLREPKPAPRIKLEDFDSEKHGVPW